MSEVAKQSNGARVHLAGHQPGTREAGYPAGNGHGNGRPTNGVRMELRQPHQLLEAGPVKGLPLWKRALDFTIILLLSPALLLIGLLLALIIKAGSRGPVIFRQSRIGHLGREFVLFKFRTMRVDAETDSHRHHVRQLIGSQAPMVKLDAGKDPRLIPLGAILRATGLDELPQLLNVLRGDMSIVGPRPCIPYEYEVYSAEHRRRFLAVPGLTGLWQVSGKNRTTFEEMVRLDVEYAYTQSLWLDLKIIFKTLPALGTQCRDIRAAKRQAGGPGTAGIGKSVQTYRL